jgi:two-component system C4-dicarboxylate transport sensor histidine kinase DctB
MQSVGALSGSGVKTGKEQAVAAHPASRDQLGRVHTRFARAALLVYAGVAVSGLGMLVIAFAADRDHDEKQRRERVQLLTDERAHNLGINLGLLAREIERLGLRSEMDLANTDPEPLHRLLTVAHEKSTFFNVGVAVLDADGKVRDAEPPEFLTAGTYADRPWFTTMQRTGRPAIVPIEPTKPDDAILFVVSPIARGGALVGGIDLAHGSASSSIGLEDVPLGQTILASSDGSIVFPANPPSWADEPGWKMIFGATPASEPYTIDVPLGGRQMIVAGAPIANTNLQLLRLVPREELYREARSRLISRLALGLSIAFVPLALLVMLLRSSLATYRRAEAEAVREERLSHLGEAANLIAHEVKNGLNGLRVGLDLIGGDKPERSERVLGELRNEIQRLTEFTTELMTFSKGIEPRPADLDLAALAPKIIELSRDAAAETGIVIDVMAPPDQMVPVRADPTLLHVVVSNLVGNAVDAVSALGDKGRIEVSVMLEGTAKLRVKDNGPGVAPAVRAQLFEPFVTGKPSGVGIGLALSRRIARAHGGELILEQTAAGASFLLTLPVRRDKA